MRWFRRTLEKEGWRVIEAATGRDALQPCRGGPPDLIILDLMLPEMDGFEVAEELRRNPSWHAIPIVVVTAKDLTEQDRQRLNGYVQRVLQKGAHTRDELVAEIREVVRPLEKARVTANNEGAEHMNRVFAALVLVAMAGSPVAAQSPPAQPATPDVRLFEESDVRIKGPTKMDIPLSKAPGSITVITAQQIRESNARTIPEVLRLVAGVNVRWNPMVQTIDMRGFGENPFTSRVLLLIDGVPYNAWDKGGFPQHPSLDFFVIQNIKRLEVIRGPGSALYGENAYWGVINIVTLAGEDLQGGQRRSVRRQPRNGIGRHLLRPPLPRRLALCLGQVHPEPVPDGVLGRRRTTPTSGLGHFREGIEPRAASVLLPPRRFGGRL